MKASPLKRRLLALALLAAFAVTLFAPARSAHADGGGPPPYYPQSGEWFGTMNVNWNGSPK